MTVSSPSSDPTLLVSLVQAHHARLEELLLEAQRNPPTPGVMADLKHQIVDVLAEDIYAEATVVHQAVHEMLGDGVHADVVRDARRLEDALYAASALPKDERSSELMSWLATVSDALADHRQLLDADVLPNMASQARDLMAHLGYRYSEAVEVAGRRHH
jgi:hypothetical protein